MDPHQHWKDCYPALLELKHVEEIVSLAREANKMAEQVGRLVLDKRKLIAFGLTEEQIQHVRQSLSEIVEMQV